MNKTAIETKLAKLAELLLDGAIDPPPIPTEGKPEPRVDPVDVFKAVSAWYLATMKAKPKESVEPLGSFNAIRETLNGAPKQ